MSPAKENPPPLVSDGAEVIARHPRNTAGRDFVVGDIHGMFAHLRILLADIDFDEASDRVFSVGDLVDRGPHSHEALEWLDHPWFHACRGNHEQFAIDSLDPEMYDNWITYNGGAWWLHLSAAEQEAFRKRFLRMPLAMEVDTRTGVVGIVHADVPPRLNWDRFTQLLDSNDEDAVFYAIWSRNRIQGHASAQPVSGGVERVYCGHTPTRETVQVDNVYYIDTGAAYSFDGYKDARLTLVQIHPERHREYSINTNRKP